MAGKCSHKDCHDPDSVGCNIEGCAILADCKYYGKTESKGENSEQDNDDIFFRIPWTGNSFGLRVCFGI